MIETYFTQEWLTKYNQHRDGTLYTVHDTLGWFLNMIEHDNLDSTCKVDLIMSDIYRALIEAGMFVDDNTTDRIVLTAKGSEFCTNMASLLRI